MSDFIILSCPTCGGKLHITDDIERFVCANCGNEHLVRRGGGTISLVPLTLELRKVQAGVKNRTASELAIKRIKEEIRSFETRIDKLLDKIYEVHPEDYLVDEKDMDKVLILLEQDILHIQKSSPSLFRKPSGALAKSNALGKFVDEMVQLPREPQGKEISIAEA